MNEHPNATEQAESGLLRPVILDFDASVPPLSVDEVRIPVNDWQEAIRFGCTLRTYAALASHLDGLIPPEHGCVFTGSGDYHHLSLYLLRRLARRKALAPGSLDVVVCDNHPDNMRYPFGLHCGSWVRHAAALACIRHIHVIGITSPDITFAHAWENYLMPLARKKLFYWSVGRRAAWLGLLGRGDHVRSSTQPGSWWRPLRLWCRPAVFCICPSTRMCSTRRWRAPPGTRAFSGWSILKE